LELRIIEERPNPLMKRTEYRFEVAHSTEATPSRDAVRAEVAKAVKVPKDRVIIERMNAKFGTAKTLGDAVAYQTKEAAEKTVREHILIRNGLKQKAEKAAPGTEAAAPTPAPAVAPAAEKKGG